MNSIEGLLNEKNLYMVKTFTRGGKIIAAEVYKKIGRMGNFRKMVAAGSDGTEEGKRIVKRIMKDDATREERQCYTEVSEAPEHLYTKYGALPIPNVLVPEITGKEIMEYNMDGYHYTRMINGRPVEKILVVNCKNADNLLRNVKNKTINHIQ